LKRCVVRQLAVAQRQTPGVGYAFARLLAVHHFRDEQEVLLLLVGEGGFVTWAPWAGRLSKTKGSQAD